MKKREVLKAIDRTYEYHEDQMQKITLLLEGKKVSSPTPVMKTQCEFGKWLYGDASRMRKLIGLQFYNNMEIMHEYWHIQYEKIYNLYYQKEQNFLTKLFGNRRKLSKEEREEIRGYYKEIETTTKDLLVALTASKRRVLALSERLFEAID